MSAGSFTLIENSEGSSPILFARMIFHIVLCPDKMADSRKLAISTILDLIVECRHQPRKQNLPHLIYQESVGDACEIWQIFFARPGKKKKKHAKILPIVLFGVIVAVAGIASITVLGNVDTCKNQ